MVKAKIEIIAGNEDNLMFSQANGKKAQFFYLTEYGCICWKNKAVPLGIEYNLLRFLHSSQFHCLRELACGYSFTQISAGVVTLTGVIFLV